MSLLILPNQLFKKSYFPAATRQVIIWEHPHYFTSYKFNRLKLVFHRVTMQLYKDYLESEGLKVKYVPYSTRGDQLSSSLAAVRLRFFEPDKISLKPLPEVGVETLASPNFLIDPREPPAYKESARGNYVFNNFYMVYKKRLNIIPDMKSLDQFNRLKIPKDEKVPDYKMRLTQHEVAALARAISYIRARFAGNPGPEWRTIVNNWNIPLTHRAAKRSFTSFITHKFRRFAAYQDALRFADVAIDRGRAQTLFHSNISTPLNVGLINPRDMVATILTTLASNKKVYSSPAEAYIRQLFWREYQLFCYLYAKIDPNSNYFGGRAGVTKKWYTGATNILPVDICIKKAFSTGYLHHIERLMIIGNYMVLSGIRPKEGFRWFMEFSTDSYEWVVHQNVYEMVFFNQGIHTMKRPYVSSANYVLKMSDLVRVPAAESGLDRRQPTAKWIDKWDSLYHKFIKENRDRIGYPYSTGRP